MTGRPRIFIADDHHMLVEGLRNLLEPHFEVAGFVYSGADVLDALGRVKPDAMLLDLSLPGRSGMDLLPDIRDGFPLIKVLIVTMHVDRVLADAAILAGAHGFVPKDTGADELVVAINEILAGRRYLSPRLPRVSNRVSMGAQHLGFARLTPRQQEIVKLIGAGRTSPEIADALGLSEHTIGFHRSNIRRVLGIEDEWGLIRYAIMVAVSLDETAPPTP